MTNIYNTQPAKVDLYLKRGDTINLSFDIKLNDEEYDLGTAAEVLFTVKTFSGIEKTVLKKTGNDPGITVVENNMTIKIPDGVDYHGSFKYDLEVQDEEGGVFTVMEGKVIVSKDVS